MWGSGERGSGEWRSGGVGCGGVGEWGSGGVEERGSGGVGSWGWGDDHVVPLSFTPQMSQMSRGSVTSFLNQCSHLSPLVTRLIKLIQQVVTSTVFV